ncbi:hypothetical protein [Aeromonas veronii]|uniref:hypothetical protein n=1 Tax=Aeromonas veronii TaxID=654 RepID=UPI0038B628D3
MFHKLKDWVIRHFEAWLVLLAFDGFKKVIEPLPEHLKAPEWLWVRKLRTGRRQWLNRNTCQLVPMP